MSGGPLLNDQRPLFRGEPALEPFECYGVMFGEHSVYTPDGVDRHGTAIRLDTLRNASGPATGGLALAE